MVWFKCGLMLLPSTFIFSLSSQIIHETSWINGGLVCLYAVSAAIAGKIVYDRYQQVNILGSLTNNPSVTSFTNKVASTCASLLFLGVPIYMLMVFFKVDSYCVTALNICLCAFATLYMWMQGLITVYFASLYYDRNLTALRQCLASFSSAVLLLLAIFGVISTFMPKGPNTGNAAYICLYITNLCSYVVAVIYGIYIMSFEKEYVYFGGGADSDLFDGDDSSTESVSTVSDTQSLCRSGGLKSNSMLINTGIFTSKHS